MSRIGKAVLRFCRGAEPDGNAWVRSGRAAEAVRSDAVLFQNPTEGPYGYAATDCNPTRHMHDCEAFECLSSERQPCMSELSGYVEPKTQSKTFLQG